MAAQRTYLAIDLKSFYASVECVDRHLDPRYHQFGGSGRLPHRKDSHLFSSKLFQRSQIFALEI